MKALLVVLLSALSLCVPRYPGNTQDKPGVLLIARGRGLPWRGTEESRGST